MTTPVRLGEDARSGLAALRRAVQALPAGKGLIQLALEEGAASFDDDEVLVVVLGPQGCLASRRTVQGRPVSLRELRLRLAGAEVAVERIGSRPEVDGPPLSAAEATLLDEVGFIEREHGRPGALEKSQIAYELLLRGSFTLEHASKLLGVNPSRLRQRLGQRTLYGIKEARSWRLPKFQFDTKHKKLVRGIEKVFPRIRGDAQALEVATWFSVPHQDLVVGVDDERVTPLAWLSSGASPETVADLAEEI
jgi:hypothetical protein